MSEELSKQMMKDKHPYGLGYPGGINLTSYDVQFMRDKDYVKWANASIICDKNCSEIFGAQR